MFVRVKAKATSRTYYGSDGDQRASRGAYLLLASTSERDENGFETLYGAIRSVSLRQLGQFMMGHARIARETITVSGSFGSDGLPIDLDHLSVCERWIDQYGREKFHRDLEPDDPRAIRVRARFVKVDPDLAARYWRDPNDGWTFGDYRGINAIGAAIAEQIASSD